MENTLTIKLKTFIKKNISIILLLLILLIGAFFRLYRISEYLTFLGDEGRDVLVVKRMLIDGKLTLLGPTTSVGSIYMGPIYYYMITPFLWLWNYDPSGPAVMVALLSVATIFLIYKLGTDFFHKIVGLMASFFYAISPLAITSGRASWNPNVVPFFSVLLIYALLNSLIKKRYRWFLVIGFSLGVLFQLHYVTLLFIPVVLACFILVKFKIPGKNLLSALFAFLLAYSPFLLFELRHQFVNTQAAIRFVISQRSAVSKIPFFIEVWNIVSDVTVRLFWRLITVESAELAKLFIVFTIFVLFRYYWTSTKKREESLSFKIIILWLTIAIFSFVIYRGVIYDYYFGSFFAVPFILLGLLFFTLWRLSKVGKILSVLLFLYLVIMHIKNTPIQYTPNNMLGNTRKIAQFVYDQIPGKPYNFALIAYRNSDHAYRYFLELWGKRPVTIENPDNDPERKTVTDQLLVVCEEKVCQPLGHSLWEIAGFGPAEIAGEWQVVTARVFKLVHYQGI